MEPNLVYSPLLFYFLIYSVLSVFFAKFLSFTFNEARNVEKRALSSKCAANLQQWANFYIHTVLIKTS